MKTYFLKNPLINPPEGSAATMRCYAIAKALNLSCINIEEYNKKNNLLIILKPRDHYFKLIQYFAKDNFVILDPVDRIYHFFRKGLLKYIHAGIFYNPKMTVFASCFKKPKLCRLIPHHWDPKIRFWNLPIMSDKFRLGYVGDTPKTKLVKELQIKTKLIKKTHEFSKDKYYPFNAQWIVRSDEHFYGPSTKLATCAALGHIPLIEMFSPDLDFLPKDWPFTVDTTSIKTAQYSIEAAKKLFLTPVWFKSLQHLRKLKNYFSLEACLIKYINLIKFIHKTQDKNGT